MTSEEAPKEFTGTLSPHDTPQIEIMKYTVKLIMDGFIEDKPFKFYLDPSINAKIDEYITI